MSPRPIRSWVRFAGVTDRAAAEAGKVAPVAVVAVVAVVPVGARTSTVYKYVQAAAAVVELTYSAVAAATVALAAHAVSIR